MIVVGIDMFIILVIVMFISAVSTAEEMKNKDYSSAILMGLVFVLSCALVCGTCVSLTGEVLKRNSYCLSCGTVYTAEYIYCPGCSDKLIPYNCAE